MAQGRSDRARSDRGDEAVGVKLTQAQVEDVRWWHKNTSMSDEAIGKRFGVSGPTIAKIITGAYRPAEDYRSANARTPDRGQS